VRGGNFFIGKINEKNQVKTVDKFPIKLIEFCLRKKINKKCEIYGKTDENVV
jgi:hypothetical protein